MPCFVLVFLWSKGTVLWRTYVLGRGCALEVWLDGLVLLVEVGEIRYDVLDNVCVGERVDLRLLGGVGRDAAWISRQYMSRRLHSSR